MAGKKKEYIWDQWSDPEDDDKDHILPPRGDKSSAPSGYEIPRPPVTAASSKKISPRIPQTSSLPPPPSYTSIDKYLSSPGSQFERISKVTAANLERDLDTYDNDDDFSSIGFESLVSRTPRQLSVAVPSSADSVKSTIDDLKAKIERIKSTIQEISAKNKSLKAELIRVQTSKERKMAKLTGGYESQLAQIQDDQQKASQQLVQFQDKLLQDVKQLQKKFQELQRRQEEVRRNKPLAAQQLRAEHAKKLAKFLRSLEHEELASFEKQYAAKHEAALKERQNLEVFTPRLQELIRGHKEAAAARQQDLAHLLEKERLRLQEEHHAELTRYKEALAAEKERELAALRKAEEAALAELGRKMERDGQSMQEDYFEKEKKKLLAAYEHSLNKESSLHQTMMENLLTADSQLLTDFLEKQKAEAGRLLSEQDDKLKALEQELVRENESLEKQLQQKVSLGEKKLFSFHESRLLLLLAQLTNQVLAQLRDEYQRKRQEVSEQYDKEIDNFRLKTDGKLKQLRETEERSLSRLVALRSEVESLRSEHADLKANKFYLPQTIEELRRKAERLRQELREKEQKAAALDEQLAEQSDRREQELQQQLRQLRISLQEKSEERQRKQQELEEKKTATQAEYANELDRIQQKIRQVLQRKETAIEQLRVELEALRATSLDKETRLEELRALSYN